MHGHCTVCEVEGDLRRGMCTTHYNRWRRGSPLDAPKQVRVYGDVSTRLLAHSEDRPGPLDTPCRVWTADIDDDGYGRIGIEGRSERAHRVAYRTFKGPLPAAPLVPDHRCRVRACINWEHLEFITSRENTLRGDTVAARNAAKEFCPKDHPYSKANTYIRPDGRGRECRTCHGWQVDLSLP